MNCPRCHSHLHAHAQVTDGPNGLVAAVPAPVAVQRRHCACGLTYTLTSTTASHHQPALTLIEGAA